jgi:hypothetical protein
MFCLKELKGLCLGELATALGVVFQDEINKRLANDHTHLNRLAGLFPDLTATTLENSHIRGALKNQITNHGIRDDLFQVSERDVMVRRDYRLGEI